MLSEIRRGYEITPQIKKVWAIQVKTAQYILDVCKKNNLKIWADGGTLLGVVREHGYIPWDDDIDFLMLRADYDKLVAIAHEEFQSPYFFQCAYTEDNYYRGHAQVRYKGTTAILPNDIFMNFDQSIFVDIFAYDSIPDIEDAEWKRRIKRANVISSILNAYNYGAIFSCQLGSLFHSLYSRIFYRKAQSRQLLFKEYENLFRYYKLSENQRISCPCFNRKILDISTKEKKWFSETIYMPFEDIEMPVPIGYDMVLKTLYGEDYMTPRKAPSQHGSFLILDSNHSYTQYLPALRKKYKKERWARFFMKIRHKFFGGKEYIFQP